MKDMKINGKMQRVFVLKEGEAADIVIPLEALTYVNYRRIKNMNEQRGELMEVMSKTTLSNGKNALKQFENLIVVVKHNQTMGEVKGQEQNAVEEQQEGSDEALTTETATETEPQKPKKRGPGRPPKKDKQ